MNDLAELPGDIGLPFKVRVDPEYSGYRYLVLPVNEKTWAARATTRNGNIAEYLVENAVK
jgi:hypothetical protein